MSRSGYSSGCGYLGLWRGAVESAIRGKRGQTLLRDMLAALDALPNKRLIAGDLVRPDGECCAMGSVALARGEDVSQVEPTDRDQVADAFKIAPALAAEIAYVNDEEGPRWHYVDGKHMKLDPETPEQRWTRVRAWVATQIVPVSP